MSASAGRSLQRYGRLSFLIRENRSDEASWAVWALYGQVAVPMELRNAGRLTRINPLHSSSTTSPYFKSVRTILARMPLPPLCRNKSAKHVCGSNLQVDHAGRFRTTVLSL